MAGGPGAAVYNLLFDGAIEVPLYEYVCKSCGHRFERIQKFSDPPVADCPSCGGPVEKQISSPAIQFKGSGWYITDYARSGKGESKKDSSAPAGEGEKAADKPSDKPAGETKSSESKAESKSETKAGTKTDKPGSTSKPGS
jgi:putative FmdB family regulatory protein